jgi:hypothetical protein
VHPSLGHDQGARRALVGPRETTVLDEAGTVRLHPLAIIAQIDVDPKSWSKHLGR